MYYIEYIESNELFFVLVKRKHCAVAVVLIYKNAPDT